MHPIDLGISPEEIEHLTNDFASDSSVLFIQDCSSLNGTFESTFNQTSGILHDLSMSEIALREVQILSSTLNHYWM